MSSDFHALAQAEAADSAAPGLKVIDLRRGFNAPSGERIEVLRGVTLSLNPGESIAITGASGSGKSTLLHLIGGLDTPDHGAITLGSTDLATTRRRDLAHLRQTQIGFVFQFHYLLPDFSAVENVALPLLIARLSSSEAFGRARQALSKIGLESRIDHPVGHLSGGEQQRVAVVRALIGEPKLVLADEPTGNLDSAISEEIGRTLVEYAHSHAAIVVIATHNKGLAGVCDRHFVIINGRLWDS